MHCDIQDWNGTLHADSDASDDVFDAPTSESVSEEVQERRKHQKKEKPVRIRPYSEKVEEMTLDFLNKKQRFL